MYIYLENSTDNFFVRYGFCPLRMFFLFNCVCWFLIVMRCSDPLMTPGSDILRQSPKEEFQHKMEQVGSHDRVPKSGNKYCHISHQIWMYSKNTNIFSTSCWKQQYPYVNMLPQMLAELVRRLASRGVAAGHGRICEKNVMDGKMSKPVRTENLVSMVSQVCMYIYILYTLLVQDRPF
jgi:hypothetical protein